MEACLIACESSACPIEPSSPATSPPPKSMNTMIPFAVDESTTEPSTRRAVTITTRTRELDSRAGDHVGRQVPGEPDDGPSAAK